MGKILKVGEMKEGDIIREGRGKKSLGFEKEGIS